MCVSCGTSATARASARRATRASGAPSSVTVPSVGAHTPASSRSSVLLPEPFGPTQRDEAPRLDADGRATDQPAAADRQAGAVDGEAHAPTSRR